MCIYEVFCLTCSYNLESNSKGSLLKKLGPQLIKLLENGEIFRGWCLEEGNYVIEDMSLKGTLVSEPIFFIPFYFFP